jgi:acyl carrier protein
MENRVRAIMAVVFSVPVDEIRDDAGPESLGRWDSLRHMKLIMALEEEFGLEFTDQQIVEMVSFRRIVQVLGQCLQAA